MYRILPLLSLLATPALAAPGGQTGSSGMPLALYCNTVPHLAVQRSDSVDNWVRICTVWFKSGGPKLTAEEVDAIRRGVAPAARPAGDPAPEAGETAPAAE